MFKTRAIKILKRICIMVAIVGYRKINMRFSRVIRKTWHCKVIMIHCTKSKRFIARFHVEVYDVHSNEKPPLIRRVTKIGSKSSQLKN